MSGSPEPARDIGLGRDGLERLFPRLAEVIDATPAKARERLLAKAFLLLADIHGDVDAALRSLDEAVTSSNIDERRRAQ